MSMLQNQIKMKYKILKNLNRPMSSYKAEAVIKVLPIKTNKQTNLEPDVYSTEFY